MQSSVTLFVCSIISLSAASNCPSWSQTREVVLSDASIPINPNSFTSINVTIRPTSPEVSQLIRFIPAVTWTNFSCKQATNSSLLESRIPLFPDTKFTKDILDPENFDKLPEWSLWADRSVLVLNINSIQWNPRGYPCPQLYLCSILGLPSDSLLNSILNPTTLCHEEWSEFSISCRDSMLCDSGCSVLFSVSSALAVQINELGQKPSDFNSTLNFVVSAGYRLPPDVFHCPPGLFACPLAPGKKSIQELPKSLTWSQRICLPESLRCDGVVNCPGTDFDEQNCPNPPDSIAFSPIQDESIRLYAMLNPGDGKNQSWLTPKLVVAGFAAQTKETLIFYTLLLGIPMLCISVVLIVWAVYKRTHLKRYASVRQSPPKTFDELDGDTECSENGFTKEAIVVSGPHIGNGNSDGTTKHVEPV